MESSKKRDHAVSSFLFWIGGILTFLGFLWPGWVWILLTPGDVEMLTLAALTVIGIVGVLILIAGGFRRAREKSVQEDGQSHLP